MSLAAVNECSIYSRYGNARLSARLRAQVNNRLHQRHTYRLVFSVEFRLGNDAGCDQATESAQRLNATIPITSSTFERFSQRD